MLDKSIAIFLFAKTANMAQPWADAGYICYCIDIQHAKGERVEGSIIYVGADARYWRPPYGANIAFIACFPPCTHVAVSGARWFVGKGLRLLAESIELFAASVELCEWSACVPYMIENPVSVVSGHWRKPNFTFHPWHFAGYLDNTQEDNTSKLTCLWTGGGFIMPEKKEASEPHRTDCHFASPGEDRANIRSATNRGFARAVFEANYKNIPLYFS